MRGSLSILPAPPRAPNTDDTDTLPFPDAIMRAQLRRDAEAADIIELQPCQRLDNHVLRYAPR